MYLRSYYTLSEHMIMKMFRATSPVNIIKLTQMQYQTGKHNVF